MIDFATEIEPLLGATVSYAWKGFGSSIFLELGALTPPSSAKFSHPAGKWCISIQWDWRVETGSEILFGSSNSGAEISSRIAELEGVTVNSIETYGLVPELLVSLSTGACLRTSSMVT